MTKRMIDADALIEWISKNKYYASSVIIDTDTAYSHENIVFCHELENQIRELAENAEPDPWCYDMDKAPKDGSYIIIHCNYYIDNMLCSWKNSIGNGHWVSEYLTEPKKPIAWMPIPKAPKGATNATDI